MSWESPIDVYTIANEMETALDNEIVTVVQRFGFDVNKEELTKALQYDRGQYQKGFADGRNADKWIPVERELPEYMRDCTTPEQLELLELARMAGNGGRDRGMGRPTKKDRRDIEIFMSDNYLDEIDFDDEDEA